MNLIKIEKKVKQIIKRASKIYYHKKFFELYEKHKFEKDDVTNNDVATQNYIKAKLLKLIPGSSFIGEEGSQITDHKYVWILDPIDGTQNYKRGLANYGTQLALQYDGSTVLSVIYFPVFKEMYVANSNGATLNGRPITVSKTTAVDWAVIAVNNYIRFFRTEKHKQLVYYMLDDAKSLRVTGCRALDFCTCAKGGFDALVVVGTTLWDFIPGQYLLQQAGGFNYVNKDLNLYISGNKEIVENLKRILEV